MAEGFITRHIKIGDRRHTENRMIIKDLDMAARNIHDGKISRKCIYSRPFSLLKSDMRVYAGGECARETEFIRRHLTNYEIYRHYILRKFNIKFNIVDKDGDDDETVVAQ
jgi:hypothetical protein